MKEGEMKLLTAAAVALLVASAPLAAHAAPAEALNAYNRGATAQKARNLDAAIGDYTQALQIDPSFEYAWANRGTCWLDKGDDARAVSDLTRAIRLDGSDVLALGNRGKAYLHQKRYDEAISDFDEAIRLGTADPKVYLGRALARGIKGDDEGAAADLAIAKQKDPSIGQTLASAERSSWRLLMPMTIPDKATGKFVAVTGAPLWSWLNMGTFASSQDCEAERRHFMDNPLFRTEALEQATGAAECVSGDDQRLRREAQ
jgi:tetratricopeptide (TPR) repeat protein